MFDTRIDICVSLNALFNLTVIVHKVFVIRATGADGILSHQCGVGRL